MTVDEGCAAGRPQPLLMVTDGGGVADRSAADDPVDGR